MKIDWVQKLTSRKFWAAIVAVITCVCVIFGVSEITTEQVTALVMAVGALIAYILGEGWVDGMRAKNGAAPGADAEAAAYGPCEEKKDAARVKKEGTEDADLSGKE